MKRFALFPGLPVILPVVLLLAGFVAPLVTGGKTLILRDILQTHFLDRIALGEGLRQFDLPLVDPLRAGGQALAGNLNALPFYPDNLLLLAGGADAGVGAGARSTLWALNAHFWLHWFVALAAAFWMGRAFGLPPAAAWMGATVYAFSGYFASQLNLYNTVVAAALAPALIAAFLETAPGKSPATRRRGLLCAALLWALLLLGGEPLLAVLALAAAAGALAVAAGGRSFSRRLGLAVAAGTLLAAPQIVEMARILPLSFRNNAAFGEPQAIVGSFRAAHLADLFWPFFFGRPSLTEVFAPQQFDGYPPLLFTLYPGMLALALAMAGALLAFGRRNGSAGSNGSNGSNGSTAPAGSTDRAADPRRRTAIWGIAAIGVALFFALGRFNPIVEGLWSLPWGRLLRFPAKFWLLGAVGGSLLAGLGFESALTPGRRQAGRMFLLLALLSALFGLFLAGSMAAPETVSRVVAGLLSPHLPAAELHGILVRLQGLSLLSIALLLAALALLRGARRAPMLAAAGLIFLHAATQLWAMLPAVPMDDAEPYLAAPPLLAAIPAGSVVVHGANLDLFRPGTLHQGRYPDSRILWLTRRSARELYPFTAVQHGLRAELAISPEGLDSFLTQAITVGLRNFSDRRRIDLLEALGVDYLLLDRELAPEALSAVREVARDEEFGQTVRLYELADRAREAEFATRVIAAPHMNAALEAIFDPAFDPHRTAVVAGSGAALAAPPAAPVDEGAAGSAAGDRARAPVRFLANGREEVIVDVEAGAAGVLFLRRAYLALWQVEVDGRAASTLVAQVARLGVAVPAGHHRVRFWIDRRPLAAGLALALLGLVLLGLVLRRPARPDQPVPPAEGRAGA